MRSRLVRVLAPLSLLGAIACHRTPAVTPLRGGEPGIPHATWPSVYFQGLDAAVASAGLTPLRTQSLPPGVREVRVWVGGGITAPEYMYRFVERDGKVRGTLLLYWPTMQVGSTPDENFDALMRESERGRCVKFGRAGPKGSCEALFTRTPNWGAVLRKMEGEGLWTLEDPSTLPSDGIMVFDGWGITVELRDGTAYRAYQYENPGSHPSWPHGKQAIAMARALRAVDSLTLPSGQEYRGITSGRYESAFTECGTGRVWEFEGALEDRWKIAARDTTRASSTADTLYQVTLRGTLGPAWLARYRRSKYERPLNVIEILSVREARPGGC